MHPDYNPNATCPCGSRRTYRRCCLRKGIRYTEDEHGNVYEVKQLSPETKELFDMLYEQRKREIWETEGREIRPDDPVFPDFAETGEQGVIDMVTRIMERAGSAPENIYAFRKTGILLCAQDLDRRSPEDIAEWEAAVMEYRAMQN